MCHQKQILDSFCATMHDESLLLITVENSHLTTCQNAKGAAKPILLFIEKFVPDFHKSKDLLDRILLGYDRVITTEGLWVHPHGVTKEMEQLVHQNFLLSREFEDHLCDFCKQYVDGGSVKDVLLDHFEDILGKVCMMTHVVARLFASLYSQGFGVSAEDHVEDTGRDVSQDANGTGMGEGAGVNDVSDQINDEDQLLGAFEKPNEEKVASNDVPGENDVGKFPHEKEGILKFYGECWKVCFN